MPRSSSSKQNELDDIFVDILLYFVFVLVLLVFMFFVSIFICSCGVFGFFFHFFERGRKRWKEGEREGRSEENTVAHKKITFLSRFVMVSC